MDNVENENKAGVDAGLNNEGPQNVGHTALKRAHFSGGANKKSAVLVGLLIVLVLTLSLSWLLWSVNDTRHNNNVDKASQYLKLSDSAINSSEYQALFLTNGQVYFGKLSNLGAKYVTLTNIYYLQVQQSLQQAQSTVNDTSSNTQVSLAKLGSELHAPEDKMQVSSEQVLFWENLKPSGKVAQAINKYQNQ
jgi:hypothetical protein